MPNKPSKLEAVEEILSLKISISSITSCGGAENESRIEIGNPALLPGV